MVQSLYEFCGDTPFFDSDLLLNNTYPEFTECFQTTVLVWVPCGFLWLTLPFYLHFLVKLDGVSLRLSTINVSKTVISLLLFFVMVVDLTYTVNSPRENGVTFPTSFYTAVGIKAASFLLSALLIQVERRQGMITSGILFIFWFLLFVTGVVPVYTKIMKREYEESIFRFVQLLFYFALLIVQLVLCSFAEQFEQGSPPFSKFQCPELNASFPSKLSFWWITSLILQIYRRGLVKEELWELNPRDQSRKIVPEFLKAWDAEITENKRRYTIKPTVHGLEDGVVNECVYSERSPLLNANQEKSYNTHTCTEEEVMREKNVNKGPSLLKVIVQVFGKDIMFAWLCKLISDLLLFVGPVILSALIGFVEAKNVEGSPESGRTAWKGYVYAASMFVISMTQSIILHQNLYLGVNAGMRIKSTLIATIYKKSLSMSSEARTKSTMGEIVNLMAVDAQYMQDITGFLWIIWSAPLQVTLAMVLLWQQLGPSVLAGIGVMTLLVPLNAVIAIKQRRLQVAQMRFKDARIKAMNEILNGMKVLKLYAWEPSFERKVHAIRDKELIVLKKFAFLNATSVFLWNNAPLMVCLSVIMTYILSDSTNTLNAQKVFVSLSLFRLLTNPFNLLPTMVSFIVQGHVSIGRIRKFLQSDDLDPTNATHVQDSDNCIAVENGNFSWGKQLQTVLKNINFEIPEGKLVAVVGQVGSGKSSLVSAILGEMEKLSGHVKVKGTTAYVPQQPWIQNVTIRNNILFGMEFEYDKYQEVVEACALDPDLAILTAGDQTEIGEKGINLSGGQKQRVSLARAVYHNADLYLLDDPLSAVDSHVGKHIFDKVIGAKSLLKNKTRLLVTHGVHWLPMVDSIIVLVDGRITEMGSYEELLSHDGAFAQFLKTYLTQNIDDSEDGDPEVHHMKSRILDQMESVPSGIGVIGHSGDGEAMRLTKGSSSKRNCPVQTAPVRDTDTNGETGVVSVRDTDTNGETGVVSVRDTDTNGETGVVFKNKPSNKLIDTEKTELGDVSCRVYFTYFKATGYVASVLLLLLLLANQTFGVVSSIWLASWTDDPYLKNFTNVNSTKYADLNYMYLGVYGAFGVGQALLMVFYSFLAAIRMVRATRLLHNGMLSNILKLPMSFFDTTPLGRIVNRFSRDVDTIDNIIWQNMRSFLIQLFGSISVFVIIGYSTPVFTAVLLPVAFSYYLVQRFYMPAARQLKRTESTSRSPIYSHFAESIQGVSTIRGYQHQHMFIEQSKSKVDTNLVYYFSGMTLIRWLALRLDLLGNFITLAAALFAILSKDISAGLVGLSVSYALQMTSSLKFLVRSASDVETNFVSVERVKEYTEEQPEADWFRPAKRPPSDWPNTGSLQFNNYSTRYRKGLDLVLNGISCDIQNGERVGIVGRTGAGKSSLTVALFRIIEAAGGNIVIDGERISDLGLHDLRSRITILPQDPVLFSGTLRMNLDPLDKATDAQVWQALEHAHLKSFVDGLHDKLYHECGEGGQNLSVGQRQLLCLARTLLRKTKILVLDEATAAVDMEMDDLIQKTIREEFRDCTILTIAHRLNTIMDYDKIMVLDRGLIREFDSPQSLLQDTSSNFYGMAKDAGLV